MRRRAAVVGQDSRPLQIRKHLDGAKELPFSEVSTLPNAPGVYEIWAGRTVPLKVGIAVRLRERLRAHAASRQSGLRFKPGGPPYEPSDVRSTKSILAKHLYFDRQTASDLDLTTEEGRRTFLSTRCCIRYRTTASREAARAIEERLEATGKYRYQSHVRRLASK